MRWIRLAEPLDRLTLQAIRSLLDLTEEHIAAVWEAVRRGRGYRTFTLRLQKKREIHQPNELLRELQQRLLIRVFHAGPVSPAAYAGVPGRSVLDVARRHLHPPGYVLKMDIKDAYDTTSYRQVSAAVARRLRRELWLLGLDRTEAHRVVGALACCLTVRKEGGPGRKLPLGAPSSVALFNLVCLELDGEIMRHLLGLFPPGEVAYTRYVDDLVFSSARAFPADFETSITRLVRAHDFEINTLKTRRDSMARAVVCGLQWNGQGIVPAERVRTRLVQHIQRHLARLTDRTTSPRQRLHSILALRSLEGLLRLYYERQGTARPPELTFAVPELPDTSDFQQLDLLWH